MGPFTNTSESHQNVFLLVRGGQFDKVMVRKGMEIGEISEKSPKFM